jgi:type II secretory pathway pseudopilin PulG
MPFQRKSDMSPNFVIKSVTAIERRHHGMTMVEVMVAAVIIVIAVIGTMTTFVSGRKFIVDQQFYREAAQLASQKFEELKAQGYDKILDGDYTENVTYNNRITYEIKTQIEPDSAPSATVPKPCKKVTVSISWTVTTDKHTAILVTYIGP